MPPTDLPPVPRSVAWSAIGAMFAVMVCSTAMFLIESGPAVLLLAIIGLGGPILWASWMRSVLARAGGAFVVPEVRTHAESVVASLPAIPMPMILMALGFWAVRGPLPAGDGLAAFGAAALNSLAWMFGSFGLQLVVPPLLLWRSQRRRRLAVPAWRRWLVRQRDPRWIRWTTLRERASDSERTRALADDVLRELEAMVEHPEGHRVRLAEIDAAADRLEPHLGAARSSLQDRVEEAVAELDAVSEVDRMARTRIRQSSAESS